MANKIPLTKQTTRERQSNSFVEHKSQTARATYLTNYQELADAISGEGGELLLEFGEVSSLAAGSTETLLSITVPAAETYVVGNILLSGNRIAIYELYINGTIQGRRRTWYSDFNQQLPLLRADFSSGDTIEVKVTNNDKRPGDFESTLSGVKR